MVEPDKIPYRKGSLAYNLMVDDWSDLTTVQIAEVLGSTRQSITSTIQNIYRKTGYRIPHVKMDSRGKPLEQPKEEKHEQQL